LAVVAAVCWSTSRKPNPKHSASTIAFKHNLQTQIKSNPKNNANGSTSFEYFVINSLSKYSF
jgi:hypothetical protein